MTEQVAQDLPAPRWCQLSAGLWDTYVAGHHIVAMNHPNLYPRTWRVTCDGEEIVVTKTLRAAQSWVEGKFCCHRWNVRYSGHHWHIGLCTTRPGEYTHFEALEECKRREATGMVPA